MHFSRALTGRKEQTFKWTLELDWSSRWSCSGTTRRSMNRWAKSQTLGQTRAQFQTAISLSPFPRASLAAASCCGGSLQEESISSFRERTTEWVWTTLNFSAIPTYLSLYPSSYLSLSFSLSLLNPACFRGHCVRYCRVRFDHPYTAGFTPTTPRRICVEQLH